MLSNAQTWQRYSFDLTRFAGQTIIVRMGVVNDGQGGQPALYYCSASACGHNVDTAYISLIMISGHYSVFSGLS
jgi:hypothetical protein